jgi:hypothetical protein
MQTGCVIKKLGLVLGAVRTDHGREPQRGGCHSHGSQNVNEALRPAQNALAVVRNPAFEGLNMFDRSHLQEPVCQGLDLARVVAE